MKINWGTGITIAIILFITFILSFVYKTLVYDEYEHHLISEDYYKDELYYQKEIDKMNNASKLEENVKILKSDKGLTIQFPSDKDFSKIKGTVVFKRLSNDKLDFNKPIVLTSKNLLIPGDSLVEGKWNIIVDWQYEKEEYLLKESVFY